MRALLASLVMEKKTLLLPLCMKRRITICRDEIGNAGSSTGTAARSTPSYIKENLSRNLWSGTAADRKHLHLVFFLVKNKTFRRCVVVFNLMLSSL